MTKTILFATLLFGLVACGQFSGIEPLESGNVFSSSKAPEGTYEAVFLKPNFDRSKKRTIVDRLIQLINNTEDDGLIRVSVYHISTDDVAMALLKAQERGVRVYLITQKNDNDGTDGFELLKKGKGSLAGLPKSRVIECKGCVGNRINHNKYFMFNRLKDGSKSVVALTSANLTSSQRRNYNDLLIAKNNSPLYQVFKSYWKMQKGERAKEWKKKSTNKTHDVSSNERVYFFPRVEEKDPIVRDLEKVSCDDESIIRVAQILFTREKVAEALRNLSKKGCDVKIIAKDSKNSAYPSKKIASTLGSDLMIFPSTVDGVRYDSIHTKILLVKAKVGKSKKLVHRVYTGSHNFNMNSLEENDETYIRVDSASLFAQYLSFWNDIENAFLKYEEEGVVAPSR